MAQFKDYYQIMGVERNATPEQIKRAYRKLARQYHPDVNKAKDAEERFKELGEAYEVLKDPQKRARYDQLGSNWHAGQEYTPPPGWQRGSHFNRGNFEFTEGFSDFFNSLFGEEGFVQPQRRSRAMRGGDIRSKVSITLEEAYSGCIRNLQIPATEYTTNGALQQRMRQLRVKIPTGVIEGQQIRLAGQGHPGSHGGAAGDLYLEIHIQKHPLFHVQDSDVHLSLPITPWEAALGAIATIPTLGGKVELKIPAGSQSGQVLRLKGRGLPAKNPGDQMITLQIHTPPAQSDSQKAFYTKMAQAMPFNPRSHL